MAEKEKLYFLVRGSKIKYDGIRENKKRDFHALIYHQKIDNTMIPSVYRENFDDNSDDITIVTEYETYLNVKKNNRRTNSIDNEQILINNEQSQNDNKQIPNYNKQSQNDNKQIPNDNKQSQNDNKQSQNDNKQILNDNDATNEQKYTCEEKERDEINNFINFVINNPSHVGSDQLKYRPLAHQYNVAKSNEVINTPSQHITNEKMHIYLSLENVNIHNVIIVNKCVLFLELYEKITQKLKKKVDLYFIENECIIYLNDDDSLEIFKLVQGRKKLYYTDGNFKYINNYTVYSTYNYYDSSLISTKLCNTKKSFVSCWAKKEITVTDIYTKNLIANYNFTCNILSCDYVDELILIASDTNNMRQFNVQSKKVVSKSKINNGTICFCKYGIDNSQFLVSTMSDNISIYDSEKNDEIYTVLNKSNSHYSKFINKSVFISGFVSGLLTITDMREKKQIHCLEAHSNKINHLSNSNDELYLSTCSANGEIKIWDVRKMYSYIDMIKIYDEHVKIVEFMDNDKFLVSCGNNCIKIYDIDRKIVLNQLCGHRDIITDLYVIDKNILSASQDGYVKIWT